MTSEKHKSRSERSERKHKSSHGEKKRKREHEEDSHRRKSKKHRSDKAVAAEVTTISNNPIFQVQTSSLYLPLSPVSQRYPIEGLCAEHLSPLILQWYPPFSSVILSYSNPRMSAEPFGNDGDSTLLQNIDEYAVSWAWVTAEFLLFKPDLGSTIEGYVNLQNEGHLGLVCWNMFNASIERKRLPEDWKWVGVEDMERGEEGMEMGETYAEDGAGYFVDGEGKKIDGLVKFRIRDVETDVDREKSFLSLAGTMLDAKAEKKIVESEIAKMKLGKSGVGRRLGGSTGLGATRLDAPVE
ncbi:DNA-directed RNA polymerase I subunit RPA43 [Hyphodiscus hymeniophilus]|uniref:DNA-directed RNA polymerase subunit n=1 Tax=Hyphodiscus hymeniophilus TaxID=353542 RepID=A0A9P6VS46_9HELO|nr:DNA-directed RNA polymerase I subunit RPA43 [Hyphodiscus hymeniophilus]